MWKVLPCVITADIRGSRQVGDRTGLQQTLNRVLERANERFADVLLAPFRITLGDEWQGLLQDVAPAFAVVRFFRKELYPFAARYGVGEGQLDTELTQNVTEMDGPVFHRSREALSQAKEEDLWLVFRTRDGATDALLTGMARLAEALMRRWSEKQRERFFLLEKLGSQKAVAEELGIGLSAVNQSLRSAGVPNLLAAEKALDGFLRAWGSGELARHLLEE